MVKTQRVSAGLLMCRHGDGGWEFLLAHPGGPYFVRKDHGAWTLPKGLVDSAEEELLDAARREFVEETGFATPDVHYEPLGHVAQKSGKRVQAWAFVGDCDPGLLVSNTFELEWPPRSGKLQAVPEIDRASFFDLRTARLKLIEAQLPFLDRALLWLTTDTPSDA